MRTGVAKALKSRALGSSSPIYAQSVHFMKTKYLFSGKWQKVLKWDENTTPYWKIWQVVLTRVAWFWEGWCWKMNFLCSKLSLHGKSAFPLNCCHHRHQWFLAEQKFILFSCDNEMQTILLIDFKGNTPNVNAKHKILQFSGLPNALSPTSVTGHTCLSFFEETLQWWSYILAWVVLVQVAPQ